MRVSRHQMFMGMAHEAAKRSTCPRMNVGAIAVIRNRLIFAGYNGAPSGHAHCTEIGCLPGKDGGCRRAVHAEVNALSCIPGTFRQDEVTLYVTMAPCDSCVDLMRLRHVKAVYYDYPYRDMQPIIRLSNAGIKVLRLVPSGYLINAHGEVVDEA